MYYKRTWASPRTKACSWPPNFLWQHLQFLQGNSRIWNFKVRCLYFQWQACMIWYRFLLIPVFLQLEWFAELLECSFNFGLIGLIFFWKSCTEPEISKIVGCLQVYLKNSKELRCWESLKLCHTCQVQICRPHSLLPWGWAPQVGWLEMPGGDGEEDSSCQKQLCNRKRLKKTRWNTVILLLVYLHMDSRKVGYI